MAKTLGFKPGTPMTYGGTTITAIKQERPDEAEIRELAAKMVEANKAKMVAASQTAAVQNQTRAGLQSQMFAANAASLLNIVNRNNIAPKILEKKQTTNIPEDKKPIDEDSQRGRFGWVTLGKAFIPYILRQGEQYCAVRMVENKLLNKYLSYLHADIYNCTCIRSYYITDAEARILNEINVRHCDAQFGRDHFTNKDLVVRLQDAAEFYNFLDVCYNKLLLSSNNPKDKCGFIRINGESVVPYTVRNNVKYVPLFYFEGETDSLKLKAEKLEGWDLAYLKFCCKVQGIRNELFASETCSVISLNDIKSYFPSGTSFEDYWPSKVIDSQLLVSSKNQTSNPSWTKQPAGAVPASKPVAPIQRSVPVAHTPPIAGTPGPHGNLPAAVINGWAAANLINGQQYQAMVSQQSNIVRMAQAQTLPNNMPLLCGGSAIFVNRAKQRLEARRERAREARAAETNEQREVRLQKQRERTRAARATESEAQREHRLKEKRNRAREVRAGERANEREKRLKSTEIVEQHSQGRENDLERVTADRVANGQEKRDERVEKNYERGYARLSSDSTNIPLPELLKTNDSVVDYTSIGDVVEMNQMTGTTTYNNIRPRTGPAGSTTYYYPQVPQMGMVQQPPPPLVRTTLANSLPIGTPAYANANVPSALHILNADPTSRIGYSSGLHKISQSRSGSQQNSKPPPPLIPVNGTNRYGAYPGADVMDLSASQGVQRQQQSQSQPQNGRTVSSKESSGGKKLIQISDIPTAGNHTPYQVKKVLVDNKMVPCINLKPFVYSELLMTLPDLVKHFFPNTPVVAVQKILQDVLNVILYKGNRSQMETLKVAGKCVSENDNLPLIQVRDVMQYMPQMKYVLEHNKNDPAAKRQRTS